MRQPGGGAPPLPGPASRHSAGEGPGEPPTRSSPDVRRLRVKRLSRLALRRFAARRGAARRRARRAVSSSRTGSVRRARGYSWAGERAPAQRGRRDPAPRRPRHAPVHGLGCLRGAGYSVGRRGPGAREGAQAPPPHASHRRGRRLPDPAGRNPLNQEVASLPASPNRAYVASIGGSAPAPRLRHEPLLWDPLQVVGAEQPKVPIKFTKYRSESDPGPYPVPPGAPIEGGGERPRRPPRARPQEGSLQAV